MVKYFLKIYTMLIPIFIHTKCRIYNEKCNKLMKGEIDWKFESNFPHEQNGEIKILTNTIHDDRFII